VKNIFDSLKRKKLIQKCIRVSSRMATKEEILSVHSLKHVEEVEALSAKATESGENVLVSYDTYANEYTCSCAFLAAGTLLNLTEMVVKGEIDNGFAIIRPPGHHAEREEAMGFCFFNNVAVAAKRSTEVMGVKRVMIIDWDVHHGNGTEHIFKEDPNILYFSMHRYDNGTFYPRTGHYKDCGEGQGEGFTINCPWNGTDIGDTEYLACIEEIVLPIGKEFQPELVLISCGFDCAFGDPLGMLEVTPKGFARMTELVCQLACGKVILALEGGYNLKSISKSAIECVKALLGERLKDPPSSEKPRLLASQSIEIVKNTQRKYWKCFASTEEELLQKLKVLSISSDIQSPTQPPLEPSEPVVPSTSTPSSSTSFSEVPSPPALLNE